jgi:hypothetical protein
MRCLVVLSSVASLAGLPMASAMALDCRQGPSISRGTAHSATPSGDVDPSEAPHSRMVQGA